MGWVNCVVIEDWKVIFEISRHVDELDDSIEKILNELSEEGEEEYADFEQIKGKKLKDISLGDLNCLIDMARKYSVLSIINDSDVFLLYWLKSRGIRYKIIPDYSEELKDYSNFRVLRQKL